MMAMFPVAFIALLSFSEIALAEKYTCVASHHDVKTGSEIKTENVNVEMTSFLSSCRIGPCKSLTHIRGGNEGDSYSFSLIAHNAKPPVVAVMIMNFRIDSQPAYEGSSLAGTAVGNRVYANVRSGSTDISIE